MEPQTSISLLPEQQKLVDVAVAAMKGHDWTYRFSDDPHWYRKGCESEQKMKAALRLLPQSVVDDLWKQHAFEPYSNPAPRVPKAAW
jgi:hypothetical protein